MVRGQLKINQMAFMLIAVTLLFVLVGLVVLSFNFAKIKKTANLLEEENAKLLVSKLANSPEFACGDVFSYGQSNCIDADKIMVFDKKDYQGFWKVADIEIRKIYPSQGNVECTLNNYPNCDIIKVYSRNVEKGPYESNFVSLCRKEKIGGIAYDKCEIAKLLISPEVKE